MNNKLIIFDFDGTITENFDFLHYLSSLNGKGKESNELIQKGIGIKYLNQRLELLKGLNLKQININFREKIILRKGIKKFILDLYKKDYILVLITGSPDIVLNYLDLKFDYVIAPKIYFNEGDEIINVEKLEEDFKIKRIDKLIDNLGIAYKEIIYFDDCDYAEDLMKKVGLGFTVGNGNKIKGSKYLINDFTQVLDYF